MEVKTVFVLNTGSSSVKASLLCPQSCISTEANPQAGSAAHPHRIVTAHAQRLLSENACLEFCISITAAGSILGSEESNCDSGVAQGERTRTLRKSDSLQLSSRGTAAQNDHLLTNEEQLKPDLRIMRMSRPNMTHEDAIRTIIETLNRLHSKLLGSIAAVGHRVVHGGSDFSEATLVDDDVVRAIENVSHLAPLHNPSNLLGIKISLDAFPNIPNVAVFDTAFHSTIPRHIYTYPLPREYTEDYQIRKYGFHGTSVQYVSLVAIGILEASGKPSDRMLVAHLGNGASVTAVVNGQSVDTTMGFTPLSGIMMGTRCGSVDPSIVTYASKEMRKPIDQVMDDLNSRSGLYGVSRGYNDMRAIIQRASEGDEHAQLAIDMYVHILAKHICGLMVSCGGGVDALVFTAGIGENSPLVRKLTVEKVHFLLGGAELDDDLNDIGGKATKGIISMDRGDAGCTVMVVRTDEEAMICAECEIFFG